MPTPKNPHAAIPANVDPQAAALLARAYALDNDEQSRALYRDWAETYDRTMLDGLKYLSPAKVAALYAAHQPRRDAAVLDVGCGTGLAGRALASLGFTLVDGLDVSPEMLEVAHRHGVYRSLFEADLNRPLDLPDACYAGAVCCGTFTHGHVDARCLDELFRVLQPGAPFAFTVKREVWNSLGFEEKLQDMMTCGGIEELAFSHDRHYQDSEHEDGVFCVYART